MKEKLSYGFGDLASVLYWQTFMAYLLIFYTDVFGITAAAASWIFLGSRLWDGVNDPLMGVVADRTQTRWGKFRPYLLWMSVPLAVFGVLTFTTPDFGSTGKVIWACCTFIPLMMLYTAINIPYTALMGVVTSSPTQRTQLSSVKFIFAFTAGTLISAFLMPMTRWLGGDNLQKGWQLSFVVIGVLAVVFFTITFLGTKERVQPPVGQKTPLMEDLKDLLGNRPWVILVLVTISFVFFVGIRSTVSAYYVKYFAGQGAVHLVGRPNPLSFEEAVSWYNTVGQVASVVGVLLLSWFAAKVGKKRAYTIMMSLAVACTGAYFVLQPDQFEVMLALQALGSLGGGAAPVLLWAMYADTADYSDLKRGRRATGLVFSASTMSQKIGWALAAFIVAQTLNFSGFVANEGQNETTIRSLVYMMSLVPAVFGVISIALLRLYPLGDEEVAKIEEELAKRGSGAQA